MKYLIIFIIFIFQFHHANADYRNMSFVDLVCKSDYAAIGTIVKMDEKFFYLKVEKFVLNKMDVDTIPIAKFKDWACAKRYSAYEVGQRELVFFRKTRHPLSKLECMGFGGGDEFELPIDNDTVKYQIGFFYPAKFEFYHLSDIENVLLDYSKIKLSSQGNSKSIDSLTLKKFSKKSKLNDELLACLQTDMKEELATPLHEIIANVEMNFLYKDYDNKLYVNNFDSLEIAVDVDEASVKKEQNYFSVKPNIGISKRSLFVRAYKGNQLYFSQYFDVIDLPKPSIYFNNSLKDTVLYRYEKDALPTVALYIDDLHKSQYLKYKLLSYEYEIVSNGKTENFICNNEFVNLELKKRVNDLKDGDVVTLKNIYVQFPNAEVKQMPNKKVYFKRLSQD